MTRTIGLLALLIFILALVPRLAPKENFTQDEVKYWVERSENFLDALQRGDVASTAQSFHPGVMTMWTGAASILLDRAFNGEDHPTRDNLQYRMNVRWMATVVNALAVSAAFLMLVQLLNVELAFVAALLWALDIFGIEHGGIMHVDGLSTSFMYLALIAGLLGLRFNEYPYRYQLNQQIHRRWWIASGVFGGLAVATKYTTISVIGILALVILVINFRHLRTKHLVRQISPFIAWGLIAFATFFVVFPAMWGLHFDRILNFFRFGVETTFAPHFNYFMGKPISVPPPTYYLIALVIRMSPVVMLGLLLFPFALRDERFSSYKEQIIGLSLFVVAYLVLMTLQLKQLDRYILQVFPLVDTLAAFGIVWLIHQRIVQRFSRQVHLALAAIIIAGMLFFWWSYYPYTRAYYNPILGGGAVAEDIIAVGDGEGFDAAARWIIDQHPNDLCDQKIATTFPYIVELYLPCAEVVELADWKTELQDADYAIMYVFINQRIVHETDTPLADLLPYITQIEPAHQVVIHQIDYAQIYDLNSAPLAIDWENLAPSEAIQETTHDSE